MDSLRHLVPPRWWETAAALKVTTLKPGRGNYGMVLSLAPDATAAQLDDPRARGIDAIDVFAPAAGQYAYAGLDTVDHDRIDLELGTMEDFRRLVRLAHLRGMAVVIFPNLGYFSVEAPDWLAACDDLRLGRDSEKRL